MKKKHNSHIISYSPDKNRQDNMLILVCVFFLCCGFFWPLRVFQKFHIHSTCSILYLHSSRMSTYRDKRATFSIYPLQLAHHILSSLFCNYWFKWTYLYGLLRHVVRAQYDDFYNIYIWLLECLIYLYAYIPHIYIQ